MTEALAKAMFLREVATYDADPETVEFEWLTDPDLRTFWFERAQFAIAFVKEFQDA